MLPVFFSSSYYRKCSSILIFTAFCLVGFALIFFFFFSVVIVGALKYLIAVLTAKLSFFFPCKKNKKKVYPASIVTILL